MSASSAAPPRAVVCTLAQHCLHLDVEPGPNALLRVLEPFVIHDVMPCRIDLAPEGGEDGAVRIDIHFSAPSPLAERLEGRLAASVVVRAARLVSARDWSEAA
ncbi:hypothetical protein [Aquabacter spiritensis]|uniref:Uncharacterized protein n=1 Tax=Aquabacter spiritensis TaxID=933073 RepID=A0A4R3M1P2_9HYPH|nr:hypothetical protein [Aquabacter spiritensis]TCT05077.1 hypothetical protein EDC64_105108 [Aquabacter spiritensis]